MMRGIALMLVVLLCRAELLHAAGKGKDLHLQVKVVCDGVDSWAKSKLYKSGDECVFNKQLWSAAKKGRKTKPNSRKDKKRGKWNLVATCPLSCSGVSDWVRKRKYKKRTQVLKDGNLYTARRNNKKKVPPATTNRFWMVEGPCEEPGTAAPSFDPTTAAPSSSPAPTRTPTKAPTVEPTSAAPSVEPSTFEPTTAPVPGAAVCLKNNGAAITSTRQGICAAHEGIRASFRSLVRGQGPYAREELARSDLFAQAVRFAFHDSGEFDITNDADNMRADGCLSDSPDNAGLIADSTLIVSVMDPLWQEQCHRISRADFYVLFSKLVIEEASRGTGNGGSIVLDFNYGRADTQSCGAGAGRLPNAQLGIDNIRQVFETQMGLTVEDGITLSGANTLGHVHAEVSGYTGAAPAGQPPLAKINAWDNSPAVFDNRYWRRIQDRRWRNDFVVGSGNTMNIWNANGGDIMLTSDIALVYNDIGSGSIGQECGGNLNNVNCQNPAQTTSEHFNQVNSYAASEQVFFDKFKESFKKMTSVGYGAEALTDIDLGTC